MKQTRKILSLATAFAMAVSMAVFTPSAMAETVDLSKDSVQPELAENLMKTSVKEGENLTAARNFNGKSVRINAEVDFNVDSDQSHWGASQTWSSSILEALQEIGNPMLEGHEYYGTTGTYVSLNSGAFQPNKTYVFRAYVKSEGTEDAYYTNGIESGIYDTLVYSNEYGKTGKKIELGDYSEYATTITLPANYNSESKNWFISILPDGTKKGAKIRFRTENADDVYLAEEQAYTLDVNAEKTNLSIGETTNVSANVLNQLGIKGALSQNVSWLALDTDRIEKVSGISIVPNENGAAVTVGADVPEGSYDIVALSEEYGMVKGVTITVSDTVEKISALTLSQEGGYVNLAASVANCTSDKVVFALAAYNGGKLADLIVEEKTVANGGANVDMMFEEPFANGTVVKAFMLAGAATMKPIANINGFNTTMTINSAE